MLLLLPIHRTGDKVKCKTKSFAELRDCFGQSAICSFHRLLSGLAMTGCGRSSICLFHRLFAGLAMMECGQSFICIFHRLLSGLAMTGLVVTSPLTSIPDKINQTCFYSFILLCRISFVKKRGK
jgi:hypothetical protein